MFRLCSVAPIAVATLTLATVAACEQGRTAGDDLFGTWAQVDVPLGEPTQRWTFRDDLTYEKTGPMTESGIFFVEGTRLTVEDFPSSPAPDHLSFDYVATDSHWLENAAFATSTVAGRVGTWQGYFENITDQVAIDYIVTLRSDRTVHEIRRIHRPSGEELYEGDGTWADSPTGSSFTITTTLSGPGGPISLTYAAWRLGDAIGGPLYERVSF